MRPRAACFGVLALAALSATAGMAAAQVSGTCVANCSAARPALPAPPAPPDPARDVWFDAIRSTGEVRLERAGGGVLAGQNMAQVRLRQGDRIVVGPSGETLLGLPDGSAIHVGPNSELVFDDVLWLTEPQPYVLRLVKGMVRYVGSFGLHPEPKFELYSAAVGIRGTTLELAADPDGSGYISLIEGAAQVTDEKGEQFDLRAGAKVTFSNFQISSRP
jgi:hypothetical protein